MPADCRFLNPRDPRFEEVVDLPGDTGVGDAADDKGSLIVDQ